MHEETEREEEKRSVLTVASYACECHYRWYMQTAWTKSVRLIPPQGD